MHLARHEEAARYQGRISDSRDRSDDGGSGLGFGASGEANLGFLGHRFQTSQSLDFLPSASSASTLSLRRWATSQLYTRAVATSNVYTTHLVSLGAVCSQGGGNAR